MADRPYTLLSCQHLDGRLPRQCHGMVGCTLSNAADFDRVDAERGAAATRSSSGRRPFATTTRGCSSARPQRRAARVARGCPPSPTKVTVTTSGEISIRGAAFFAPGDVEKLVYCRDRRGGRTRAADLGWRRHRGGRRGPGRPCGGSREDLRAARACGRLMVEGGRRRAHPAAQRGPRRRAAPRGRARCSSATPAPAGSWVTPASPGRPDTARPSWRCARSGTWRCCGYALSPRFARKSEQEVSMSVA